VFTEGAVGAEGTIARVIQHSIVRRQCDGVILAPAHGCLDAPVPVFERFDVSVREVVQAPLVGLRARQSADHRIVHRLGEDVWHAL
jgi:hypothetical protein